MRLQWNRLLNRERFRPTNRKQEDRRNEFERDYDRLLWSSAFRRLQDKAQVFPLERDDFIRTRLTHSLEVSSLGASLIRDIYRQNQGLFPADIESELKALVSTACLIHDIGNPPFGHSGEYSIQKWFQDDQGKESPISKIKKFTEKERSDFTRWEGNAQGLRIALKLQRMNDKYGLNFTYATLASMMKYIKSSSEADPKSVRQSNKKPGYFQSEESLAHSILQNTGTDGEFRHPLAFIVEAADDIAYAAADIEDAVKKGVVSIDVIIEELEAAQGSALLSGALGNLKTNLSFHKDTKTPEPGLVAFQNFRIEIIGVMFRLCVAQFSGNYSNIMNGYYDVPLADEPECRVIQKTLKSIAKKHVYTSNSVLTLEVTGDRVRVCLRR